MNEISVRLLILDISIYVYINQYLFLCLIVLTTSDILFVIYWKRTQEIQ